MGLSAHQSAKAQTVEWLTPPDWIERLSIDGFDLDPCTPERMPWETAARMVCKRDADGLAIQWDGRVWLNPPFGSEAVRWLRKLKAHGNGIALVPARTETTWFYETVWGHADSILFVQDRPHFHVGNVDGAVFKRKKGPEIFVPFGGRAPCNSGAPICLIAYGRSNRSTLERAEMGAVTRMEDVRGSWRMEPQPKLDDIVLRERIAA